MSKKKRSRTNGNDASIAVHPAKRPRRYTEENAEMAQIFEDLAHEVKDIRIKAAATLVRKMSPDSSPSGDLVTKTLTRLIRGLCSGRKAARSGFFVALVEVLRTRYDSSQDTSSDAKPSVNDVVGMVTDYTEPEGKAAGQERKDHLLGRVFGHKALIQSSILFTSGADPECWTSVLDYIFTLAHNVPWLRDECGVVLCDAIRQLSGHANSLKEIDSVIQRLCSANLAKTPEGVAIWLTAMAVAPDLTFPKNIWRKEDPLCVKERTSLAKIMKEDYAKSTENGEPKIKSGSSQPKLKEAWDIVLASAIQKCESKARKGSDKADFGKFWKEVVDNSLFSASASYERKSWGFQLFSKALKICPVWNLEEICSPNLMRCIVNQRNDQERYLHDAAKKPLDDMRARVKREPSAAASLVAGICVKNQMINFDHATKTKTLENLICLADESSLESILSILESLIYNTNAKEQRAAESSRRTIADLLVSAVRSHVAERSVPASSTSWLGRLLRVLVDVGYFLPKASLSTDPGSSSSISDDGRSMFQSRLSSCLTSILTSKLDPRHIFPSYVVSSIRSEANADGDNTLIWSGDAEITRTVMNGHRRLDELVEREALAEDTQRSTMRALILLYSLTLLQVYNGDADAVSILDELQTCYLTLVDAKENGSSASEVLIEVLLSFLSKPSTLFKKLGEQVFEAFAPDVTAEGLQSMLEILLKKENISGQQELFDRDPSDVEEEDDAEDAEASDVEVISEINAEEEGHANLDDQISQSGSDQENPSDQSDAEGREELAQFDALLAQTLQTSKANQDETAQSSSSDEDMDDEQMMALEPQLTKIFRERKQTTNKKKDLQDAKDSMIQFKIRVLSLLQVYVKGESSNPLALDVIIPILRMIRQTSNKQIAEKGFGILKQFFDASKSKGLPVPSDASTLWAILDQIHDEATKYESKLFASACSRSSLFTAKVLLSMDRSHYDGVVDVYSRTQKQWYGAAKPKLQPSFFTEWISWSIATKKRA